MKIVNSNLSFTAKLIQDRVNIGRLEDDDRYHDFKSNFVEILPECDNDVEALKNAVKYWGNDKFGMNACYAVQAARNNSKKNGFCENPPHTNAYTWVRDIFDRF